MNSLLPSNGLVSTNLGPRLLAVRGMARLSQEEMAKKLKVALRTYVHYEHGTREPGAGVVAAVGKLFDIDPGWLLYGATEIPERRGRAQFNRDVLVFALDGILSTCKELPQPPNCERIAKATVAYYQKLIESGFGSDEEARARRKYLLAV